METPKRSPGPPPNHPSASRFGARPTTTATTYSPCCPAWRLKRVHPVDGIGHFTPLEAPADFADIVQLARGADGRRG